MKDPAQWKQDTVLELITDINKYKTVALLDMENLPAKQLQIIKKKIRSRTELKMTRKNFILRAIDSASKEEAKKLINHISGMPALLFSNESAFELFKILKQNMSPAAAKAGQKSPKEILIGAGPTSFAPGPIISDLGKVGLKTGIEGGKIVIKEEKIVAKEGDVISEDLANVLSKLEIHPMKIGINMICALEDNYLFMKDILNIDEEEFLRNIKNSYLDTLKLAVGARILTAESAPILIKNAYTDAKKLGIGAEILADEIKEYLLKKAESQINALKSKINI